MVNNFNFRKVGFPTFFLFLATSFLYSQNKNAYPELADFRSWGYHISPVLYTKATNRQQYGEQSIKNLNIPSFGFGITKLFRQQDKISFKTGVYIEFTAVYNFKYKIAANDIYPQFGEFEDHVKMADKWALTIPTIIQVKKRLDENIVFNLEAGFQTVIMPNGEASFLQSFSNEDQSEVREMFGMYAANATSTNFYPNIVISPGFYFVLPKMLIQANFIYQKTILTYYEGEYQFANLLVSEDSRGDYKLSGDYIGLSFNVHLLKK